MRFRTTQYQTVVGSNMVANEVLQPTPGQVGVISDFPGTDTSVQSDYSYQPDTMGVDPAIVVRRISVRRPGRVGRTPWVYELPGAESSVDKGSLTPQKVDYAGAGRNTGAPGAEVLRTDTHGPFNASKVPNAVVPNRQSFLSRLLYGRKDQTGVRNENDIPQIGERDFEGNTLSPAGLGQNSFIMVNPRQTFDTANVPGAGTTPDGQPYVPKAGRPTEDPQYDPMSVTIANTREVSMAGSPPFLPDRVRAGAADPHQGRIAQIPHWFTFRPFDKGMASDHLSGVKGVVRTPLMGRPIATSDESFSIASGHTGQMGYRYSSPAPGMTPAGPMPNTVRQVPSAWDADLNVIDTGAANSPRGRSFRRG